MWNELKKRTFFIVRRGACAVSPAAVAILESTHAHPQKMNEPYLEALNRSRDVDKLEKIMREKLTSASEEHAEALYICIEASAFFGDLADGGKLFLTEYSDRFQQDDMTMLAERIGRASARIIDCDSDGKFVKYRVSYDPSRFDKDTRPPRVVFTLRRLNKGLHPVYVN
jgi:hypothetical protein